MEIILREDVQHLGAAGDVVKVKDGYARNYLLPKGLAYAATEANKKKIAYEAARIARQRAAERGAAETEAAKLADVHLSFAVKVGEEDKLYGSVTAGDVQRKLEELGIHVDKRKVDLPEPIREVGDFRVGSKGGGCCSTTWTSWCTCSTLSCGSFTSSSACGATPRCSPGARATTGWTTG